MSNHVFGEKYQDPHLGDGSESPNEKYDAEGGRRASTTVGGRKMSRIGPPPSVPAGLPAAGTESTDEYSKLVAMEADNAIKYRTCSWQKVIHSPNRASLSSTRAKVPA